MATDGWHTCHFCGTDVKAGKDYKGESHLLKDCRPDLVPHEPGELCTWAYRDDKEFHRKRPFSLRSQNCYAYQNPVTLEWGSEHKYFYPEDAET